MSRKRPPSPPPVIDGFEYVSLIGSGGFSDVFLYQQQRPRRRVAVKVLLHEFAGESQRAAFDGEADLMATLSTHPSIVTMYEANVAADGRPYLAMEFCSRPNLGARYRQERMSVPDVLRIGVQVGGAVETAHRLGILHRDIKPANILVTEYGHPALTDFGISSTLDDTGRAEGMSIPWSPPESFAEPPSTGVSTDVWALAATLYSLLASRSPFEVPGGANSSADLVARIESAPLRPTGRNDVPPSLERVLATAMAKNPEARYPTALAFARALQQVQTELTFAVTPIDLLDDRGHVQEEVSDDAADADDVGTRLREVVSIDPRGPAAAPAPPVQRPQPGPGWAAPAPAPVPSTGPRGTAGARTALGQPRGHAEVDLGDTVHRAAVGTLAETSTASAASPDLAPSEQAAPARRTGVGLVVGLVTLLAAAVVTLAVVLWPHGADPEKTPAEQTTQTADAGPPSDNLGGIIPAVTTLEGTVGDDGSVTFTWENPEPQDGDTYRWRVLDKLEQSPYQEALEPTVTIEAAEGEEICIEVYLQRGGGRSFQSKAACVP